MLQLMALCTFSALKEALDINLLSMLLEEEDASI